MTHSNKEKRSFKSQFKEAMVFLAIIVGVIAFFVSAAAYNFDPGEVFPMLFGFIVIFSIGIAVVAFVAAIVIRLFGLLFGKR